jgi:hypothetical protein
MWQQIQVVFSASFARVGAAIVSLVPGLVAMVLVLAVALALAALLRTILRRVLARIGFDRRAQAWGLVTGEGWSPHHPSEFVARGAYWFALLAGVAFALDVFGASTTSALGLALLAFLPRLVVGAIIFLVGVGASRFLERSVLISAVNMQIQSARLLALGVKWLVLVLGTAMALEHLGVGGALVTISFAILLGGIVLALALAVGLGSREAVSRTIDKRMRQEERPARAAEGERIQHL